jgi:hypothetical protein
MESWLTPKEFKDLKIQRFKDWLMPEKIRN